MTDPDMGNWQYDYDLGGNLTAQRDALYLSNPTTYADHQLFFEYDKMNRIVKKFYGQAHKDAGTPDVVYKYDNDLNDAAAMKSWGRLRYAEVTALGQPAEKRNERWYEYDERGLLKAEELLTQFNPTRRYRTSYTYDKGGRPLTTTYPDPEEHDRSGHGELAVRL